MSRTTGIASVLIAFSLISLVSESAEARCRQNRRQQRSGQCCTQNHHSHAAPSCCSMNGHESTGSEYNTQQSDTYDSPTPALDQDSAQNSNSRQNSNSGQQSDQGSNQDSAPEAPREANQQGAAQNAETQSPPPAPNSNN